MSTADLAVVRTCICSWMGKGVSTAVQNANDIIGPALIVSLRCSFVMTVSLLLHS
jgi:enolase